jgi:hypothetical protein
LSDLLVINLGHDYEAKTFGITGTDGSSHALFVCNALFGGYFQSVFLFPKGNKNNDRKVTRRI